MLEVHPGALFAGRFEIIKCLGAGSMGAVYLACDHSHADLKVALKVLYPGVIQTHEARERFRNEIAASQQINHPNVAQAYEYFEQADVQAYAMEYVDGGDLSQVMRKGALPLAQVIEILTQIARGLEVIHSRGVIHRDIKPENILVSRQGIYKITDFGVARLQGASNVTQIGAMVGTPKYVSPEYIEYGECDHRGDIYAVGVMAFEMITGRAPFDGSCKDSLMLNRFNVRGAQVVQFAPNCPKPLVRILDKMLSVQVTSRYQTAAELLTDLEALVELPEIRESAHQVLTDFESDSNPTIENFQIPKGLVLKKAKPKYLKLLAAFVCSVLVSISFILLSPSKKIPQSSFFANFFAGTYSGTIDGLFAPQNPLTFRLLKNSNAEYIILKLEGCSFSLLSRDGTFSCGNRRFQFELSQSSSARAQGSIKELAEGKTGNFDLYFADGKDELL